MKKFKLAFASLLLLSGVVGGSLINVKAESAKAVSNVSFNEIAWSNVVYNVKDATPDYEKLLPSTEADAIAKAKKGDGSCTPEHGYCILLNYSQSLTPLPASFYDNYAYDTSYNWGDHIKINGVYIKDTVGSIANNALGHLYVYFASDSATPVGDYYRPTVEIIEGLQIGSYILPGNVFEYHCKLGSNRYWDVQSNDPYNHAYYNSILINNDVSTYSTNKGIEVEFNAKISKYSGEYDGYVKDVNHNATSFASYVTLNGTSFSDIPGSEIKYAGEGKLWLYAPGMSNVTGTKNEVVINDGMVFYDSYISGITFTMSKNSNVWSADPLVKYANYKEMSWNGESKDEVYGTKKGILLRLDKLLSNDPVQVAGSERNVNHASDSIGDSVKLNGTAFSAINGAEIKYYGGFNLWIYAPGMDSVMGSYNTLTISDSPSIYNALIGDVTLYLASDETRWETRIPSTSLTNVVCGDSAWPSGKCYCTGYAGGKSYYGDNTKYGILMSFDKSLSNVTAEIEGSLRYVNIAKEAVGYHFQSNGVPFAEIEGAEIMYYQEKHLWVYTPDMTKPLDGKNYAQISVDANTRFMDSSLPAINYYHADGGTDSVSGWQKVKPADKFAKELDYTGIAGGWNNYKDTKTGSLILFFGTYGVDYLGSQPNNINQADKEFPIGYKLTYCGVPIYKYEGVVISYEHGYCCLYIAMPYQYLTAFNGYKVPTLHLDEDTNFVETALGEVTLYFYNDQWHNEVPDSIDDASLSSASQFDEVFGEESKSLSSNVSKITGSKVGLQDFAFDFNFNKEQSSFSMNVFSCDGSHGIKVTFTLANNNVTVSDATTGGKNIGSISFAFEAQTNYRCYIKYSLNAGMATVILAIDDIVFLEADPFPIGNYTELGNQVAMYAGNGETVVRKMAIGEDIKSPFIIYYGKASYEFEKGHDVPDFRINFYAKDGVDGDVRENMIISWPDGAVTNNKLNAGIWTVTCFAYDSSNNFKTQRIEVIVRDSSQAIVTFDGENATLVNVGDKITKPSVDPIKVPTKDCTYQFLYWTYNGNPWNFSFDTVTGDMNLVSEFITTYKQYNVLIHEEGLDTNSDYGFIYRYGTEVDFSLFEKDGYTFKVYQGQSEVQEFEVTGDSALIVKYTRNGGTSSSSGSTSTSGGGSSSQPGKGGCGGSITETSIILPIVILAITAIISLLMIRRRKGAK